MRWTIIGASCFGLAFLIAIFSHNHIPLWWILLGNVMGVGLLTALFSYLKLEEKVIQAPKTDITIVQHLEQKIAEQSKLFSAQIDETGKKLLKTQEKFAAAQKLVAVHAAEVETLKREKLAFSDEILLKTRRIAELELFLEDPKSVPTGENEYVFLYEQAKKQIADIEQERNTLETTLAQKILQVEEEKRDLENRLLSIQEQAAKKKIPSKKSSSRKK